MVELPSGNVTFLFTDIEASTQLWERYPAEMPAVLARHDSILRNAIETRNGHVFKTIGDAFCAVFPDAVDAVQAAIDGQLALSHESGLEVRVRMALHTGSADERDGDYFGRTVNRAARLLAIAHGGQTILSAATHAAIAGPLPAPLSLVDLGYQGLKDLQEPEWVRQANHPDLPDTFPPLRSLQLYRHNLPCQVTSFIGRESQLAEVERLLSSARLLTLTGSGGVGKTRLALQASANVIQEYADGVWLVELAALTEPSLVAQTVATHLNVLEEPGRPVLETLADALRAKNLLIVLDNCEHLIEASARLAESLLRACPQVRMLATSREPLQIQGEFTYRVPSLDIPQPKGRTSARDLVESGAVRLFHERAAAFAEFEITPDGTDAVAQICRSIDGIPLAIELAAARVRTLPVQEIARRLDDRFSLLTRGSRTALPRQQTLRALIDWSWDLLTPPERVMLHRFSVFSGGFTLEAAEQVGTDRQDLFQNPKSKIQSPDVLDLVTQLVDKSLVVTENRPSGLRFRLLETIREYALDKIRESGEESEFRRRHFDWSLKLAQEAQPHFEGPGMQEWLDRMELEHGNLRAALSHAPTGEDRLQLAIEMHRFWFVRGYLAEGRESLEGALRDGSGADAAQRAKALNSLGILTWRQGDLEAARSAITAGLELRLGSGDRSGAAAALNNLGLVADDEGDLEAALNYFEDAAGIYRELGDRARIGMVLANLGANLIEQGDLEPAIAASEEFLAIAQETQDPWCTAAAWHNLAEIAFRKGDLDGARSLAGQALALTAELGDGTQIYQILMLFGEIALAEGSPGRAAELLAAMEALQTAQGLHVNNLDRVCYDRARGEAKSRLSREDFTACWERGSALTCEDAVRSALASEAVEAVER